MNDTSNNSTMIRWRCHRGMLELDLMLQPFFDTQYAKLSDEMQKAFEALLACQDPDIYAWLLGLELPADEELKQVVYQIVEFNRTQTFYDT